MTLMIPRTGALAGPSDSAAHQEGQQSQPSPTPNASSGKPDSQNHGAGGKTATAASGATNCGMLETAAARYGLPPGFFRRLIRQESNFDPKAISHAGAMGIAQFMPGTARWRGLADPFEPSEALNQSARWLSELRALFGNLGLAAAAYNAGPQRVKDWIAGHGKLPGETRAYVLTITGRTADEWLHGNAKQPSDFDEPAGPCTMRVRLPTARLETRAKLQGSLEPEADKPSGWGLQLIGAADPVPFGTGQSQAGRDQEAARRSRTVGLVLHQGRRVLARKGQPALLEAAVGRRELPGDAELGPWMAQPRLQLRSFQPGRFAAPGAGVY
jgi:hypothetical protein